LDTASEKVNKLPFYYTLPCILFVFSPACRTQCISAVFAVERWLEWCPSHTGIVSKWQKLS